jgi:hypothetical protein
MKKRILSLLIAVTLLLNVTPMTVEVSAISAILGDQGITDEQLAEMVESGEIPWNVRRLDLRGNQISDLTPLSRLIRLDTLFLFDDQISDLSPLANLTNLEWLRLEGNQISDLSPLASLTKLQNLALGNNQISDLTPLSTLTNLGLDMGSLDLSNNQITDLTGLENLTNLGVLDLANNQITDVTPLQGLTRLWFLDLQNNQITDPMPLAWLTGLDSRSLRLDNNPVHEDAAAMAALEAARAANRTRTTLTLGHLLGTERYKVTDALQILRYVVGLPSVLDNCTVAVMAALIISEENPGVRDALQILRSVVGLPSRLD